MTYSFGMQSSNHVICSCVYAQIVFIEVMKSVAQQQTYVFGSNMNTGISLKVEVQKTL